MESALCALLSALVVLLCSSVPECKGEDTVTQTAGDASATQGHSAQIHCAFQTLDTTPTLFWYKQEGHGAPQYMMKKMKTYLNWQDTVTASDSYKSRFDIQAEKNSVVLKIQDVRVADSAVYYCALQPTQSGSFKLIFGAGTKLSVHLTEDYEPSFYSLKTEDASASVCLATGFSRADKFQSWALFNGTSANFIDREEDEEEAITGRYSQVALLSGEEGEEECPESSAAEAEADDTLQPDPSVNLVSLTVLALRILFVKTVAFNVFLTLRLCI